MTDLGGQVLPRGVKRQSFDESSVEHEFSDRCKGVPIPYENHSVHTSRSKIGIVWRPSYGENVVFVARKHSHGFPSFCVDFITAEDLLWLP